MAKYVLHMYNNQPPVLLVYGMLSVSGGKQTLEEYFRLMNRQFTDHEWQTIRSGADDWAKIAMFTRHWVAGIIISRQF